MVKALNWQVGKVRITAITEIEDAADVILESVPEATPENIRRIPWLTPYFADKAGHIKALVNVFIVEINNKRIIIDTGVGNFKKRPALPVWNNLQTKFIEQIITAGFDPLKIDFVINTHLHFDHIGWNTILKNDKWIPTFPNARYIIVKDEFDYWSTLPKSEIEDDLLGFKDSILPVYNAGLIDLVSSEHELLNTVTLFPTPGHTPFHSSILIKSESKQAVIVGDAFHHPSQIADSKWKSVFDTDSNLAAISRKKLLKQFANSNTLFFAAHFNTAGYLISQKDNYQLVVE